VAQVLQPGYTVADRLLRPALVGVAKAPASTGDEGAPHEGEGKGGAAAERGGRPGTPVGTTA
jgi:hypothetical protein